VAELADALGSGSSGRKAVRVQIPPSAPWFIFPDARDKVSGMLKLSLAIVFSLLYCLPLYAFESELWPGEGKPMFFARTNTTLTLYEKPSRSSPIIKKHEIQKGEKIDYDKTRYQNVKAGIIRVQKSVTLSGRKFGTISYLSRSEYYSGNIPYKDYAFQEGNSFEYLQYRAEGSCFIRWHNEVFDIDYCPWFDKENTDFALESQPVNEWWIRVTEDHKTRGWLLIEENLVEERRFF
jgi:hypothetical protein